MFSEVLKFEVRYRLRRPATYAYFIILFLMMFLAIYSDNVNIGGASGFPNGITGLCCWC